MLFYMSVRNVQIPNLRINSIKLECLDSFNFLGITIDKHLTWREHTNLIVNNISRTKGVINRFRNYIPQNVHGLLHDYLQHSNNKPTTFKLWDSYMGI